MKQYQFSEEKRDIFEKMPQPFAVYQNVGGKVAALILSEGFCDLFGYTDHAKAYADMNHAVYGFVHPDDADRISNAVLRFIAEGGIFDVVYRTKNRKASMYQVVHAIGKYVTMEDGSRLAYIWYMDEGMYAEEGESTRNSLTGSLNNALHEGTIMKAIRYDYLTGLPSMTHFFELTVERKQEIKANGVEPVLLYFDLCGMKIFNSRYSFEEGDKLLQAFAGVLLRTFGVDNCCRAGADHFGAVTVRTGLEEILNKLLSECSQINGGNSLPVHIGIYPNSLEDAPVSVAYDRAKLACDTMKKSYSSGYCFYDREMRDEVEKRQYVLSHIDQAIQEQWIQVYYQPIVRAVNEKVCDDEALARWVDPVKGFLSPSDFIPYLEDAGVIYKLDLYMLDEILKKIRFQEEAGDYVVPQSLNLSREDFSACDIVEEIRKRVDDAGVKREMITIEITESTLGRDFGFMKEQVERFLELGFPVWMDDFGSGYSSLDVLQSIKFNLIKFDMSFMQKLDDGNNGKIILTELMKMATALGVDTVCEGVETEEQVRFLQEIGCSKLQGYYYAKPMPLSDLLKKTQEEMQLSYENPQESSYYDTIGRMNLFDLAMIGSGETRGFRNIFHTLPMAIMEVQDGNVYFVRSNQSYRNFMKNAFGFDLSDREATFPANPFGPGSAFMKLVRQCCNSENRAFFDEQLQDGSTVHSFARKLSINPVTQRTAVAIAVLSVTSADEGTTYASIARALAADYYNLYYVDLETDRFIEYSSPVGGEELAMERHGEHFFDAAKRDTMTRIYEKDREPFLAKFTRENILHELDTQGVFTATYRLIDTGAPMYVSMKIMRMQPEGKHLIIGISTIDAQMKQEEMAERLRREATAYARVMALSGNYLSLYTIEPETGSYTEYIATEEYESLGFAKVGNDFFRQGILDGEKTVCPEDLPGYLSDFTKEKVLSQIHEKGVYHLRYRLMIQGRPKPVLLKIVSVREQEGIRLIAGVREWKERENKDK